MPSSRELFSDSFLCFNFVYQEDEETCGRLRAVRQPVLPVRHWLHPGPYGRNPTKAAVSLSSKPTQSFHVKSNLLEQPGAEKEQHNLDFYEVVIDATGEDILGRAARIEACN